MRNLFLGLIVLIGLSTSACSDKGKQLAASTDRVAGYIGVGLIIVDQQTSTGQMSPETGVAIVTALRQVNTLNGQLVTEAKKYVDADGNLALTGDGQQNLLNILASSNGIINTLVNDPRVLNLSEPKRNEIIAVAANLSATIASIGELIKTTKTIKGGK